jgi:ribosomal protein S18 acetylase RimI-like enzyme
MRDWDVRPATTGGDDRAFLEAMLLEGFAWRPGVDRPPIGELLADPEIALYVAGWGRAGDAGVIAERGGERLGAAWYRRFSAAAHGYGFVDAAIPELSLAVRPGERGRGVGSSLLDALVRRAGDEGFASLSLSVELDNPALRLYERAGFVRAGRVGNAWTMCLDLATRT